MRERIRYEIVPCRVGEPYTGCGTVIARHHQAHFKGREHEFKERSDCLAFLKSCSVCGQRCITDVALDVTKDAVLPGKHKEHKWVRTNDFNDDSWNLGLTRWFSGKESACQCRTHRTRGSDPWVGKILWRRNWKPTPVFLPGKSHEQRNLVGYSRWGHKEPDMTEHVRMEPQVEENKNDMIRDERQRRWQAWYNLTLDGTEGVER